MKNFIVQLPISAKREIPSKYVGKGTWYVDESRGTKIFATFGFSDRSHPLYNSLMTLLKTKRSKKVERPKRRDRKHKAVIVIQHRYGKNEIITMNRKGKLNPPKARRIRINEKKPSIKNARIKYVQKLLDYYHMDLKEAIRIADSQYTSKLAKRSGASIPAIAGE